MSFRTDLSAEAQKILNRLDRPTADRIRARLHQLEGDPFEPRISKPLVHAEGKRSSRVGGWRVIFEVDRSQAVVSILSIRPRGQAYRRL